MYILLPILRVACACLAGTAHVFRSDLCQFGKHARFQAAVIPYNKLRSITSGRARSGVPRLESNATQQEKAAKTTAKCGNMRVNCNSGEWQAIDSN